jgi:GNAT superfamily N-acetyltransferase
MDRQFSAGFKGDQTEMKATPMTDQDRAHIRNVVRGWGDDFIMSRGKKIYPFAGAGFIARNDRDEAIGVATYEARGDECELTLIEVFEKRAGAGTMLVKSIIEEAKHAGCGRLWLVTTNNNLDAMKFYEKLGFTQKAIYPGAVTKAREIKPSIPMTDKDGVEIKDEVEYELVL